MLPLLLVLLLLLLLKLVLLLLFVLVLLPRKRLVVIIFPRLMAPSLWLLLLLQMLFFLIGTIGLVTVVVRLRPVPCRERGDGGEGYGRRPLRLGLAVWGHRRRQIQRHEPFAIAIAHMGAFFIIVGLIFITIDFIVIVVVVVVAYGCRRCRCFRLRRSGRRLGDQRSSRKAAAVVVFVAVVAHDFAEECGNGSLGGGNGALHDPGGVLVGLGSCEEQATGPLRAA